MTTVCSSHFFLKISYTMQASLFVSISEVEVVALGSSISAAVAVAVAVVFVCRKVFRRHEDPRARRG